MAVALCAMTAMAVACDDDDDATFTVVYPPEQPTRTPAFVDMVYTAEVSPDMLAYLDMTLEYIDIDGNVNNLTLDNVMHDTILSWKATMSTSIPATFGMRLYGQLKEGVDTAAIPGTHFKMKRSLSYKYSLLDSNRVQIRTRDYRDPKELDIPKRNLVKYLNERVESGIIANGVVIDVQGNVNEKSTWPL